MKDVTIFTDGSCLGNPGPGGFAAILRYGKVEKTITGGFNPTTNNRMELTACLAALKALKEPCQVTLFTDSKYLADAIRQGWLQNWLKQGWRTAAKKPVKNQDLWQALLPLLSKHQVQFTWIKAHDGHPENERCDLLAKEQAGLDNLPPDPGFEPETPDV